MSTQKNILVVEDDPASRDYLVYLLEQSGYKVGSAEDGVAALEKVVQKTPDLIVSDIVMPRMDGIQLMQRLRKGPSTANIPIIFYSGTYSGEVHQFVTDAGAAQHVEKPADPQVILKAIQGALEQPQGEAPKPAFDPTLFSEHHVRMLSEELMRRLQELTAANTELDQTRRKLEEEAASRKQAAALLLKSEEQYRLLFEANPNPMWVFDLETLRFLAVNEAAVASYGYSREEFLEMTIAGIRPETEMPRLTAALREDKRNLTTAEIWKHRKKDGSVLDTEIISHTITFAGRRAKLVLAQDVTERRNMEMQLRQAQKMEAVGQLASGVAHDFNNLLGIIMGCTELAMLRLEEGSPIANKLLDVKAAAQRAAGLTRQLLLFSRQEISEPRKVDLNSTVTTSERFLRRLIHENVEIKSVLCEKRPVVIIDPGHLEQILMNLVVNARDAMPNGGSIRIETEIVDLSSAPLDPGFQPRTGLYALVAVSDTGEGMDAATKARIFEPFFTTKERGKGTGLGLATVHGIVKQAGGHITVYSEVGKGTTFKIFLPVTSAPTEEKRPLGKDWVMRGSETVLLVEDEPALRAIVRDFLQESGYKVLEGGSGAEAIAVAERHAGPIELLLTDVIMPGMSGAELMNRLLIKHPALQVLLMTGYTDDILVRQGLSRSAGLIQKPFTGHALLQKIHAVLSAGKVDSKKHLVLVADDDPIYRELFTDMLQSAGFDVLLAEDGFQAILNSVARPVDLAILDGQMSKQDGLQACKQLRSSPSTALLPMIVVSSLTTSENQQRALDAGANVFLGKPITRDELLASVNNLLADAERNSQREK